MVRLGSVFVVVMSIKITCLVDSRAHLGIIARKGSFSIKHIMEKTMDPLLEKMILLGVV